MKAVACSYCISSGSDEVSRELLICSLCFFIGDSLSCSTSEILHNTLLLSLEPWMIIPPSHFIVTSCALN